MDVDFSHKQSQRVLRQRNLLAIIVGTLVVLLCASLMVSANRQQEVILVPTSRTTMTLNSSGVSADYLENVTRDVALVALNRSPETLDFWMKQLLDVADERSRGQLKTDLVKIYQEQAGSQITQFFTPDYLKVYPDTLTSEVGGVVHTVAGSKEVSSQHRLFRFVWTYNGISLKLAGFGAVVKAEAKQQ